MKRNIAKSIIVFLLVLMTASLFPFYTGAQTAAWDGQTIATGFESGAGTQADPYVIASGAQLAYLAKAVNDGTLQSGGYYILAGNIDLGGNEWTPIGTSDQKTFSGTFDGRGYAVSNFKISSTPNTARSGLFGNMNTAGTVIKNLTISNATLTATGSNTYIGAIAGILQDGGTITGCRVTSDVTITGVLGSTGGVAGRVVTGSKVEYTVSEATVSATGASNVFVGGITGIVGSEGSLKYCVNKGSVTATRSDGTVNSIYAGGIAAGAGAGSLGGIIEQCYNTGAISSTVMAGGIICFTNTAGNQLKNCYNLSDTITGDSQYTGSIIGYIKNELSITSCFSVEISGVDLHGPNVASGQTGLTELSTKSQAEIKALTDQIDVTIQNNTFTPGEDTTAATTTTSGGTTTSAQTSDMAFVLVLLACASVLTVFVLKVRQRKPIR